MSKHSIIKAGVGIGLLASSLASTAAPTLQSFAEPMVFYKVNGGAVNYIALLPNISDSAVLMLDLYQSGSVNSWAYGVGGSINASSAGGPVWSVQVSVAGAASNSTKADGIFMTTYNPAGQQLTGETSAGAANIASFGLNSTWYGGGTASIGLAFSQTQTISSQVCFASFNLVVGTDGNLRVSEGNFTVKPSGMPYASGANYSYYPISTGASSTSGSMDAASNVWNDLNFTATGQLSTVGMYKLSLSGGGTSTFAASALPKGNLCTSMYTGKTSLNAAGAIIGGPTGLIRLW